jgi:hypothetical protein
MLTESSDQHSNLYVFFAADILELLARAGLKGGFHSPHVGCISRAARGPLSRLNIILCGLKILVLVFAVTGCLL